MSTFDHPDWLFELKYDGFRSLAVVDYGRCTLYSRNGHEFRSFSAKAEWDDEPPWLLGKKDRWYGEVNSAGPDVAGAVTKAIVELTEAK